MKVLISLIVGCALSAQDDFKGNKIVSLIASFLPSSTQKSSMLHSTLFSLYNVCGVLELNIVNELFKLINMKARSGRSIQTSLHDPTQHNKTVLLSLIVINDHT